MATQQTLGATVMPEQSPADFRISCVESAGATIGKLQRGCRIIGVTKGHFSMLDLVRAVVDQTGAADVTVCTWTAGMKDIELAAWLLDSGRLTSFHLICDRAFPSVKPEYCAAIVHRFGAESVTLANTHAKYVIIRNDVWNIVIRTSMNMSRNPRWEQFELDDSEQICTFFTDMAAEIRATTPHGFEVSSSQIHDLLRAGLAQHPDKVRDLDDVALAALRYLGGTVEQAENMARQGYTLADVERRLGVAITDGPLAVAWRRGAQTLADVLRDATVTAGVSGNAKAMDRLMKWSSSQRKDLDRLADAEG